jgi:hypothetical protein
MKNSFTQFIKLLAVIPIAVFWTILSAQPQKARIDSAKQGVVITRSTLKPVLVNNCCAENPWELTTGARNIIEAFRDLIAGTGIKECSNNNGQPAPKLTSIMPLKYYNDLPGSSIVSFVVFYKPNFINPPDKYEGPDKFRVLWSSNTAGIYYYTNCTSC